MPEAVYRVYNSGEVSDGFLKLSHQARQEGRLKDFVRAASWMMSELEQTPLEFGEARYYEKNLRFLYRCVTVRPIFLDYAVLEEEKIVFLRRFVLVKS